MTRLGLFPLCFFVWFLSGCAAVPAGLPSHTTFDEGRKTSLSSPVFKKWRQAISHMESSKTKWPGEEKSMDLLSLPALAGRINAVINTYPYVADSLRWRTSDYWESPAEFLTLGGGDCEDFALTKYLWLRDLGVPEEMLRIAVVYDRYKKKPHAVLVVSTGQRTLILDNQNMNPDDVDALVRYRPLYSLNHQNGWLYI